MKPVKSYWTYAKAVKLLDEENNCCKIVKSERLVPMLPKYIGKSRTGIKEVLDVDLGKYTEWIRGVLLGYNKIQVSQTSLPLDDQPLIRYEVAMDAIVFQPAVGKTLKCTVNEVAPDHIGCLALDYFNVSIPVPKSGKNKHGKKKDQDLQPGTQLLVEVGKIQSMHGIISIQGKLRTVLSRPLTPTPQGSAESEEVPMDTTVSDVESVKSVVVVPSYASPPATMNITSSSDLDSSKESLISPPKKKKKRKSSKDASKSARVKSEIETDTSFDDPDTSLSFTSPHEGHSMKSSMKEKKLDHDKDTEIANDSEVPMDMTSDLERSFDVKSGDGSMSSSSGKKKKKQKHSKIKSATPIKFEPCSDDSAATSLDQSSSFNDTPARKVTLKKSKDKSKRKSTHSVSGNNSSLLTKKKHKPGTKTIKSETLNNNEESSELCKSDNFTDIKPSKSSKKLEKRRKSKSPGEIVNGTDETSVSTFLKSLPDDSILDSEDERFLNSLDESLPNSAGGSVKKAKKRKHSSKVKKETVSTLNSLPNANEYTLLNSADDSILNSEDERILNSLDDSLPNSAGERVKKAKKRKHSSKVKKELAIKQEALEDVDVKQTYTAGDVKLSLDALKNKSKKTKGKKKRKTP